MTVGNFNVSDVLETAKKQLEEDSQIPPATIALLKVMVLMITQMSNRLGLNSSNSSKPPSDDPNRKKKKKTKGKRSAGGQAKHEGKTLQKVENPDVIHELKVDRSTLPDGKFAHVGFETRQVFDLEISRIVTEYRAEILKDEAGICHTAPFPSDVKSPVQYGPGVKSHSVYMSQYQLLPYDRIREYFSDALGLPLSAGSIYNFNQKAFERLADFDKLLGAKLRESPLLHADETGININGKQNWLHCASNERWTHLAAHRKRGSAAMDAIGILPKFEGILCHDHWKPYFKYSCKHSLCNAHHLRELTRVWEQDGQKWGKELKEFLEKLNRRVLDAGGSLKVLEVAEFRCEYRKILNMAEEECPAPKIRAGPVKRGRRKKTKARNLLERMRDYEDEVLRFMENPIVPFTNNRGERDVRMTKVQQKISGCFRSEQGAQTFSRVRSYISTCRKQKIDSSLALKYLFQDKSVVKEFGWGE